MTIWRCQRLYAPRGIISGSIQPGWCGVTTSVFRFEVSYFLVDTRGLRKRLNSVYHMISKFNNRTKCLVIENYSTYKKIVVRVPQKIKKH